MNILATLISEPWVQRLGWVLIYFIWQGAVVALLLGAALCFLTRASSHVRYLVIAAAMLICALAPVATWMMLGSPTPPMELPATATQFVDVSRVEASRPSVSAPDIATTSAWPTEVIAPSWREKLDQVAGAALPDVVGLWFGGVLILTIRLTLVWTLMQRLRLSGMPIGDSPCLERFHHLVERMRVGVPVRLLESALVEVPTLIGWFRPAILVPASVLTGLTPEQLEAILAHELAHVRRYDYLVNLFQTVIETALFYHPAVWWIGRKLREERENCCDDIALEVTQDRLVYVNALAQLETARMTPLALTASGGSLLRRIRRIVEAKDRKVSAWPLWILIVGILSVVCLTKSRAQETPNPSTQSKAAAPAAPADVQAQMIQATRKDDAVTLQKLIDQGVDPKTVRDDAYPTLLFDAGSPEVAEILIAHGVDVNAHYVGSARVFGGTALALIGGSNLKNRAEIARVLLKHGANPNARDPLGYTPITDAKDGATVDVLVEYGGDVNARANDESDLMGFDHFSADLSYFQALERHGYSFAPDAHGSQLLVVAAGYQNLEIMKWLLDRGVDPNAKGEGVFNEEPLERAAEVGNVEAARLLLSYGAKAGDQMMIAALHNRHDKVVKVLWESGVRNISELCYQVSQGAPIGELQKLLDQGASVNPPQDKQITPLGEAAMLGNLEAVKLLLAHNADVNAGGLINPKLAQVNPWNQLWRMSPLVLASSEGQDEIVKYLLQHGATPEPAALYQAARNSYPYPNQRTHDHFEKTVQILIDAGALKTATPEVAGLILAAPIQTRQGPPNPTVLKMLLDAGQSPELPLSAGKNGEKSNSVIGYYRGFYQKNKDDPARGWLATQIKPLLDMLETANAGATPNPNDPPATPAPSTTSSQPTSEPGVASAPSADVPSQMFQVVQKGDAATLQKLIDQGADPKTATDPYGFPLLFRAGSPEVAEMLIAHGADPNARDTDGGSALRMLSRAGGKNGAATVRVLLQHGANPNIPDKNGFTPLMAARDGATVDALVEYGADLKAKSNEGEGVLFYFGYSDPSAFEALLRHGVPFDLKSDGPTLLLHACKHHNVPLVQELLDRGVDPNTPGVLFKIHGQTTMELPIVDAAYGGWTDVPKLLLSRGAKPADSAIGTALINNRGKALKVFRENGAQNMSELCYQVSQHAPIEELQKLLDQGIPADPPQDKQISPLGDAALLGNMAAVQLLVAHHADVNWGGPGTPEPLQKERTSPLYLAASEGQDEIVAYLLQHGALPDPEALFTAAHNSYPYNDQRSKDHFEKTVRLLIDAGALKSATPEVAGKILAAPIQTRQGPPNPSVLKMLLDAGVSPESPMPYTAENGEKPNTVIGYFQDRYQNHKFEPGFGQTPDTFKPLIDLMTAADPGATPKPTDPPATTAPSTTSNHPIPEPAVASAPSSDAPSVAIMPVSDDSTSPSLPAADVKVSVILSGKEMKDWANTKVRKDEDHSTYSIDVPTVLQINLEIPGLKFGQSFNVKRTGAFPYPTEFEERRISHSANDKGQPLTLAVPMTPREFVTENLGWSIVITADKGKDGIVSLKGTATCTTLDSFKMHGVAGENTGPLYDDEKNPQTGKFDILLATPNDSWMPTFQQSVTPFFVFAKPGQDYVVKFQSGADTVDAAIRCDLVRTADAEGATTDAATPKLNDPPAAPAPSTTEIQPQAPSTASSSDAMAKETGMPTETPNMIRSGDSSIKTAD